MYRLIIKEPGPNDKCEWCHVPLKDGDEVYMIDAELYHGWNCHTKTH